MSQDKEHKQDKPIKAVTTDEKEYEFTPEENAALRRVTYALAIEGEDEEKAFREIDERIMQEGELIRHRRREEGTQREEIEGIESNQANRQWTDREAERTQKKDTDKTPPR